MAQNNLLSILVLLCLVSFLEIQCIAGRHLILDQNQKVETKYYGRRILAKETRGTLDPKINGGIHLGRQLGQMEPRQSPPKNDEDFRPTSPGHSPGAGHSVQN
ncbi:C-TERMINALLY ENCODED PEPTIDE 5 [Hibiscus trionum]|uniref:C-TERMINALLY ENCODED PEPTIDE 5 n=1 Tax=Hibiscus trionum TaxID=183268 RepID=A0A9W7LLK4_HIBTR|nr:C-TERMINALLY ENCODED PEPTIDE 5 [Hibiscus trionum]